MTTVNIQQNQEVQYKTASEPSCEEVCKFSEKNGLLLTIPLFTIKDLKSFVMDLTYKKIADWDSDGLLSSSRENNKAGWRKFSVVDAIRLRIISDLRQFGFDTNEIKSFLNSIRKSSFIIHDARPVKKVASPLEYFILSSMLGYKIVLIVTKDGQFYFYDRGKDAFYADENDKDAGYARLFMGGLLTLPFHSYVTDVVSLATYAITEGDKSGEYRLIYALTDKEKKILDIIKDKTYQQITIAKSDGDIITISAKSRQQHLISDQEIINAINSGAYQKVTVAVADNRKIELTREETTKV